jgi:hypothetical protein
VATRLAPIPATGISASTVSSLLEDEGVDVVIRIR